jgi:hypothetical protein
MDRCFGFAPVEGGQRIALHHSRGQLVLLRNSIVFQCGHQCGRIMISGMREIDKRTVTKGMNEVDDQNEARPCRTHWLTHHLVTDLPY